MALFGSNKKKEEQKAEAPQAQSAANVNFTQGTSNVSDVLKNPRITEKATMHSEGGVYTFDVAQNATKRSIAQAVRVAYKVTPRKVTIVQIPSKVKRSMRTGKTGVASGGKKAYVYLKKGETITIA